MDYRYKINITAIIPREANAMPSAAPLTPRLEPILPASPPATAPKTPTLRAGSSRNPCDLAKTNSKANPTMAPANNPYSLFRRCPRGDSLSFIGSTSCNTSKSTGCYEASGKSRNLATISRRSRFTSRMSSRLEYIAGHSSCRFTFRNSRSSLFRSADRIVRVDIVDIITRPGG